MTDTQKIRRKESKHATTEFIKSQREGEKKEKENYKTEEL